MRLISLPAVVPTPTNGAGFVGHGNSIHTPILPKQLWQPRDVDGNPPRFIGRQHLPCMASTSVGRLYTYAPRLLRSRRIRCVAALPYSTLPIRSGGISAIILAVSLTPSPKGTPGSQAPHHGCHAGLQHRRCFDDDGRMTDDTLLPFDLPAVRRKKLTVDFEGGNQSSNGGVLCAGGSRGR